MNKKLEAMHTSGSWCYQPYNYPRTLGQMKYEIWKSSDGDKIEGYKIAEVEDVTDGSNVRRTEANACLIAAAPELLYALRELAKEIDLSKLNIRKDFSLINAHSYALKMIAKAEGLE